MQMSVPPQAAASRPPSGAKASAVTLPCGWAISRTVPAASTRKTRPSTLPAASSAPSGLRASDWSRTSPVSATVVTAGAAPLRSARIRPAVSVAAAATPPSALTATVRAKSAASTVFAQSPPSQTKALISRAPCDAATIVSPPGAIAAARPMSSARRTSPAGVAGRIEADQPAVVEQHRRAADAGRGQRPDRRRLRPGAVEPGDRRRRAPAAFRPRRPRDGAGRSSRRPARRWCREGRRAGPAASRRRRRCAPDAATARARPGGAPNASRWSTGAKPHRPPPSVAPARSPSCRRSREAKASSVASAPRSAASASSRAVSAFCSRHEHHAAGDDDDRHHGSGAGDQEVAEPAAAPFLRLFLGDAGGDEGLLGIVERARMIDQPLPGAAEQEAADAAPSACRRRSPSASRPSHGRAASGRGGSRAPRRASRGAAAICGAAIRAPPRRCAGRPPRRR